MLFELHFFSKYILRNVAREGAGEILIIQPPCPLTLRKLINNTHPPSTKRDLDLQNEKQTNSILTAILKVHPTALDKTLNIL